MEEEYIMPLISWDMVDKIIALNTAVIIVNSKDGKSYRVEGVLHFDGGMVYAEGRVVNF